MKKLLIALFVAVSIGCGEGIDTSLTSGPTNACSIVNSGSNSNSACRDVVVIVQPSPSPSPYSGAADCRVDYLAGNGPDFLPLQGEAEFSLTPMQTFTDAQGASQVRQVPDACNSPKADQVEWVPLDTRVLQITRGNFSAKVKRLATGATSLSVRFDGKSKVFQIN